MHIIIPRSRKCLDYLAVYQLKFGLEIDFVDLLMIRLLMLNRLLTNTRSLLYLSRRIQVRPSPALFSRICSTSLLYKSNPAYFFSSQFLSIESTKMSATESKNSSAASAAAEAELANDFIQFIRSSPSQFHAVSTVSKLFSQSGYQQIREIDNNWAEIIKPGGKYFFTRNQSSIVAFAVGPKFKPGNGFTITASHTDSPVFKLKPLSKVNKQGFVQVAVQCYGGGLWYTWFDRDLSVAGRVIVETSEGKFESKLVVINKPILRIPNLAIHLNREVNDKGFAPNKQTHTVPVLATEIKVNLDAQLNQKVESKSETLEQHQPLLLSLLAKELNVPVEAIRDFELSLFDCQPATIGGALNEFIFSRALDNLMMSFVSARSLIDCTQESNNVYWAQEKQIRMVALFDNEEVGSDSLMGAGSNLLRQTLQRLNANDLETYDSAIRKSILISADMAHACHPNYPEAHEENHKPRIHQGLVIKENANQRYATTGITTFLINEIAKKNNVPIQRFVVRNDVMCGSTIGPILATNCGIRTIDVGIPQLSMHSVREMCGTADVYSSYRLFQAIYGEFSELDQRLTIHGEQ
jgi:aspartyl aminopeptidase